MKYSVIITVYNKEKYIKRAVRSVLKQTYMDFELIIVDDGSTDHSLKRAREIKDERIKIITQENMGAAAARNSGIKAASCDYIGFLDADDAWKPDFLENINILTEEYPEAGLYAAAHEAVLPSYRTEKHVLSTQDWKGRSFGLVDDYFKHALKAPFISASSVVIPRRVLEEMGYFCETIRRGEDLLMWCRIALNYRIAFCNKVCAVYFKNAQNRTDVRNDPSNGFTDTFQWHAEEILAEGRKARNYSGYFKEYILKMLIVKARYHLELNQKKQARTILSRCAKTRENRKYLMKVYMMSLVPNTILQGILRIV